MAKLLIKVEKQDVKTAELGVNILVQCKNNIDLVFTREALEELLSDFEAIKLRKKLGDDST